MTIQLVAEFPDPEVAFQPGTIMAAVDKWHLDSRDGTVYVRVNGAKDTNIGVEGTEGGSPPIIQGSDLILRFRAIGNLDGLPADLAGVTFAAQFRAGGPSGALEASCIPTVDPNDSTVVVLHLTAAQTAAMSAPDGVWDLEATYVDTNLNIVRTKRLVEGRYELSLEVTR